MYEKWVCPKCGTENTGLFCKNYPPTNRDEFPDRDWCITVHPDYWELTKDWPIRKSRGRFGRWYKVWT